MKNLFIYLLLSFTFASTPLHAESKKIIKWVDKNGVTQYGDRMPLPSKAKKASVLSNQGVTVKKIDQKTSNQKKDAALAITTRKDNALLASYNSIEEIEIARKRNIKIDELALAAQEKKLEMLNEKLAANNKQLLEFAKKNKVAPEENVVAVEKNIVDITKIEQEIKVRKQTVSRINQRYENDKKRYTELESRKGNLTDIQYIKKNITELEAWRADAQRRVEFYEQKSVDYKRAGNPMPKHIKAGLLNATRELDRASEEIEEAKRAIKKRKSSLSK